MNIKHLIEDAGYETRSYSGRCMYGKSCLGVTLDRDQSMGVFIADLFDAIAHGDGDEALDIAATMAEVFRSMRTDSLGLDTIVYFKDVEFSSDIDDEEEEDEDALTDIGADDDCVTDLTTG